MRLDAEKIHARLVAKINTQYTRLGSDRRLEFAIDAICEEFNLVLESYVASAGTELLEAAGVMLLERHTMQLRTEAEEQERRDRLRAEPIEGREWEAPRFCSGPTFELDRTWPAFEAFVVDHCGTVRRSEIAIGHRRIGFQCPRSQVVAICDEAARLELWPSGAMSLYNLDGCHGCGRAPGTHAPRCIFREGA